METEINNSPCHQPCVHTEIHAIILISADIDMHDTVLTWQKSMLISFRFCFPLYHNYNDDSIIQLSLGGVERKNYTDISIHICTFLCIYINRYILCIYLKNIFCFFTSSCAAWIFGGSNYFILFWFIFSILVIMAIFNSLLYFYESLFFLYWEIYRYTNQQRQQNLFLPS